MMPVLSLLISICLASVALAGDKITLRPVDLTKLKPKGNAQAFPIVDGDVQVNGRLVKKIVVNRRSSRDGQYVVTFNNRTRFELRPSVRIRTYNRYGMLLEEVSIKWVFDTIAEGGSYTDTQDTHDESNDLREVLEYSEIELPEDINSPAYVLIDDDSQVVPKSP